MTRRVPRGEFRASCETCGWSRVYSTARTAADRKRRHRCGSTLTPVCPRCGGPKALKSTQCLACAVETLDVDRAPKPCRHKRANHQHGTYACYVLDACRCLPCATAHRTYETNRLRQKAYGRWDNLVDAEPVRRHVRALAEQGMGWKRVAAASGVSHGAITKLLYGKAGGEPSRRLRRETADALLAVRFAPIDGQRVPVTGTRRRLRALVALGYSQSFLARRLDVEPSNFTKLVADDGQPFVTFKRDQAVRALYDDLSMRLPPQRNRVERQTASRARNHARAHGWLPPLAWDDDRIDDPMYDPSGNSGERVDYDEAVVERFIANGERANRHLRHAEAAEIVRRLRLRGVSTTTLERVYGLKPERYKGAS